MIKLKNNFVLLKELDTESRTESGIIVNLDRWGRKCKVIAASEESGFQEGQTILKNVGKGSDITIDGEDYEILHKDSIIAILDEHA